MRHTIIGILIYLIIGLFTALVVLIKSETKFEKGVYLATALIALGWPVSIFHMVQVFITAIRWKGKKNVVTSNKSNSDTNRRTNSSDDVMELSFKKHEKDTRP